MKTVNNAVVKTVNTSESKETSMKTNVKSYFANLAEKHPRLANALKNVKDYSWSIVKTFVASALFVGTLPALVAGSAVGFAFAKYKGGKLLSNKTVVVSALGVTATLAVASLVTAVVVAPVAFAIASTAVTAMCLAADLYSWFKNRKAK